MLLLDEATAAIDHGSEAAFREALREMVLAHGHTVITVAHRAAREAVAYHGAGAREDSGGRLAGRSLQIAVGFLRAWLELESSWLGLA